ncbi:MAG TPA: Mrp/NBP35 family ATP-binding protein [Rickettsiales bacterium]|nr:Mrp/NBP35 family ATP-binding protein [Rickettsiales bacterium]
MRLLQVAKKFLSFGTDDMAGLTLETIMDALRNVRLEDGDIVSKGLVSGLRVSEDGKVSFVITLGPAQTGREGPLQAACEKAVRKIAEVTSVTVVMTAETTGGTSAPAGPAKKAVWNTTPVAYVKRVIAVASGKGGVGKSTTSVNIAHALTRQGKRVGLLDADIYGPSLPRMMGISGKPEIVQNRIMPIISQGIACMSIGLLIGEEQAVIWRGPQVTKALHQMLRDVAWGDEEHPLDVLLIDMPPGTGDVYLSLAQQVPVDGAVIVTTPQEVAVADARKSVDMFQKVSIPIIGVIENMSGFADPATGQTHAIFGTGGGERLAAAAQAPLLGQVPIDMELRAASDEGRHYAGSNGFYDEISRKIIASA